MEIAKLVLQYIETLIWPFIVLFSLKLFQKPIVNFLNRVKKADLPGGVSLEAFPEQIQKVKALSKEVKEEASEKIKGKELPSIPLTESNARMIKLGLAPSPSGLELGKYRIYAEEDPNFALAGLRLEVEIMLKNLAKGFRIDMGERDSIQLITQKLLQNQSISPRQSKLILEVIKLCNMAIHGQPVTLSQAKEIMDITEVLRNDYIAWLVWGFPNQ